MREYIEKNIFESLGMTSSFYGDPHEIVKGRVSGYDPTDTGIKNPDLS